MPRAAGARCKQNFYPRSPCGERLHAQKKKDRHSVFLSTLSLRRATKQITPRQITRRISIHALLAESDMMLPSTVCASCAFLSTLSLRRATYDTYAKVLRVNISIHALLAESDICATLNITSDLEFLSTLSLRRATCREKLVKADTSISIHALLAESDDVIAVMTDAQSISIHALLAESDRVFADGFHSGDTISIHALLAESDNRRPIFCCRTKRFLSTLSLRRATNGSKRQTCQQGEFLSTLSLRRATRAANCQQRSHQISIHALLAESDSPCCGWFEVVNYFYPRSPCGERRAGFCKCV